ncbi:MAG TPA: hypothetical protein VH540_14695 [Ktedonobacterales bacterium]|jgi:hypothetical protein
MKETTTKPLNQTENQPVNLAFPLQSQGGLSALARWMIPSIQVMLFGAILLGVVFLGQVRVISTDGDTALHLRLGSDMLAQGGLPQGNFLTSADYGQPFIAWEWLSELIFASIWSWFGLNGVVAFVAGMVALTSTCLFRAVQKRGVPLLLALPLTLAAIALTSIHWLARPHIFSLLLTLWWSEQLWSYWQSGNPRKLWPFPFVLVLWANLHSGYIAGLLMLATATVLVWMFPRAASTREIMARRWQLTRTLAACCLAALITPWGVSGWLHLFTFFSSGTALSNVQEWGSPDFHQLYGKIFLVLLLLLGACGVLRGWLRGGRALQPVDRGMGASASVLEQWATREPGALGWALAGVFTAMALVSVRALPLWAVVVTPILGREITAWGAEWAVAVGLGKTTQVSRMVFERSWRIEAIEGRQHSWGWMVSLSILVVVVVANHGALPGGRTPLLKAHFSPQLFPVEAVQTIQRGAFPGGVLPAGAGFTTLEWADYIELTLAHTLVMVDSRVDAFDEQVLSDYQTIFGGEPGWDQLMEKYDIRWVLVPVEAPVAQLMKLTQGWVCLAADTHQLALLCVQTPPSSVAY